MTATSPKAIQASQGPAELTSPKKLEDQAATAALYVTKSQRDPNAFLGADNRLSSAGAAASLKYANPQDLPSFPSVGVKNDQSAAGAAASLGWGAKAPEYWKPDGVSSAAGVAASLGWGAKAPEYWKPDGVSSNASKAAMLAQDYKAPEYWKPDGVSADGARAALIASKDGGKVDIWRPEPTAWANSAATQATKSGRNNALSPQIDYGYTALGRQGSMMAATGAMSNRNRQRSGSTPVSKPPLYPDEANAVANALSAATSASASGRRSKAEVGDVGAVPYTNLSRQMYTSNPPMMTDRPEAAEKNHQDGLHASAVAMAKKMYTMQQNQIEATSKAQGLSAATAAHSRRRSNSESDDEVVPMQFNNLQEAAQKLAHERLAKLHDEHAVNREYRDYYGGDNAPKVANRLSLRGRPRRRASSDGDLDDDRAQANKIRVQQSMFNSNLSQVDKQKRQADRDALMVAAQRNVTARLSGMDEKVFRDTGKVAPSMLSEWEIKAHAAAQKDSNKRMENHGKIHIGSGQFVNQSAVDLVARKNVQPVLDDINEKAEQQRVKDAEMKMEQEAKKRYLETKKLREQEVKDVNRKLKVQDKEEEKARKADEKREKDLTKQRAKETKLAEKESKFKSAGPAVVAVTNVPETTIIPATGGEEDEQDEQDEQESATEPTSHTEAAISVPAEEEPRATDRHPIGYTAPTNLATSMELAQGERLDGIIKDGQSSTPNTKGGKKDSWFKRFSTRRKSKTDKDTAENGKPFVGGAALTGASTTSVQNTASVHEPATTTATIATTPTATSEEDRGRTAERAISPVSSMEPEEDDDDAEAQLESEEEFEEARDNFDEGLAPPPTFPAEKSSSPSRASKFTEVV